VNTLGKLRDEKDLTRSSGTKRRKDPKPRILPGSLKAQTEGRARRNFGLLTRAQKEDKAIREKPMKEKLFRVGAMSLANRLIKTPFAKWKSQDFKDGQELLGEKVIRAIISHQEKKK